MRKGLAVSADAIGLQWALSWGAPAVAAVAVVAVAVVALSARTAMRLPPRRAATLITLRTLAVAGLLAALWQPMWVELRPRPDDRRVAMVLDVSRSMRAFGGHDRLREAIAAATDLQSRVPTRAFAAADGAVPIDDGEVSRLRVHGATTDLLEALSRLESLERPSGLGSVVVISDGRDHGGLGRTADDEAIRDALAGLGVPVHTVAIGANRPQQDVTIGEVRVARHAIVRSPLPVEVDLDLGAMAGRAGAIDVILELDGDVVERQAVPLQGESRRRVQLQAVPDTVGPHVLSVRAVPLPGEWTESNNQAHVPIAVVRDRTRVLHLAGHPSWDTRALRSHLRADPTVDLVSFYIMIGRNGGTFVAAEDTTLIPFPSEQLFGEALDDFDLIVFQDFAFENFGVDRMITPKLGPWIERGGAFFVLGGRQSFGAGGWQSTSIPPWLPMDMGHSGDESWRDEAVELRATDLGQSHPVTQLRPDPDANAEAWAQATLPGTNTGLIARSGDAVLIEGADGGPLLALGERHDGRVAALASDGLWTWAFPGADGRSRSDARADYRRLLRRLRGWLLRDPAYERLRLRVPDVAVAPGADVAIEVQLVGSAQRGMGGVEVVIEDALLPGTTRRPFGRCITEATGRCTVVAPAAQPGPHRLFASADEGVHAVAAYAVAQGWPEDLDLRPAPEVLARLARLSGGKAVTSSRTLQAGDLLQTRDADLERVRTALWGHPIVLLVLLGLLASEWWLRRRWGLR